MHLSRCLWRKQKCFRAGSWFYSYAGSVLSALHLYEPLVDYAGAGASVPLIGFGHLLFQGVKEEMEQVGVLGVFTGGLKASAGGISAALIFGYLASLFFHPQMKN